MERKNRILYDFDKSAARIDDILNSNNSNFNDQSTLPSRDKLTYTNGFYVNVITIFIDIVDSSKMTDDHYRPVLAKIYRSFLSECVAVLNSETDCMEININGDCVWGVFSAVYQTDIHNIVDVAATLNSLIKILNYKLDKKEYKTISIGIGIDYGRALMVKAGYSGSALNDVIWMGDVVNAASHLCNQAGRDNHKPIIITENIYCNLDEERKNLFVPVPVGFFSTHYETDIINPSMQEWYEANCT